MTNSSAPTRPSRIDLSTAARLTRLIDSCEQRALAAERRAEALTRLAGKAEADGHPISASRYAGRASVYQEMSVTIRLIMAQAKGVIL